MKLSIITVNFNNPTGLEDTIKSVVNQTKAPFEYIVVDGASTKGDVEIIKKYQRYITKWVSEPDSGIYNAMNKAVRMAGGDYCLFMNSGDTLFTDTTIDEILNQQFDEDFVEGSIAFKNKPGKIHKAPKDITLAYYKYVTNNYHQASLIKRSLLLKYPYDETMQISADMKFNMEAIVLHNCSFKGIDIVISTYETGGRSETVAHEEEINRMYTDLFPKRILTDYENSRYLHEWPASKLMPIVKSISQNYLLFKFRIVLKRILGKKVYPSDHQHLDRLRLKNKQ